MGMGAGANYALTVEPAFVKKMASWQYSALEGAVAAGGMEFDEFAMLYAQGDPEVSNSQDDRVKALNTLKEAFYNATLTEGRGLTLDLEYHDPEEGDRYDDVSGAYWVVGGVDVRTPAGARFDADIHTSLFTTFG